jgi:gas vesicle protein
MNNQGKSLIAFLAGVAAGSAIGVLFAPEKGEVTRDKISTNLGDYRDQLKNFITELRERGEEVALEYVGGDNNAKAEGKKVVNEARQKAEKLLEDVEDLMGQIKSKA